MSDELYALVPVPSLVELFAVVGAVEVFHTTPLADIVPPPALIELPPLLAELEVIDVIDVVLTDAVATAVPDAVGADEVR